MSQQSQIPEVQFPVSAYPPRLIVDGDPVYAYDYEDSHPGDEQLTDEQKPHLPERANDAYWTFYETDIRTHLYQCWECGYLTMARDLNSSAYRPYECSNTECQNRTQVGGRDSFRECDEEDPEVIIDFETNDTRPLSDVTADNIPNHPSHLGRLKNDLEKHITHNELLKITADAVAEARDHRYIDY